ncbi:MULTISPECIES: DUF2336 domain-containing protein [unclassified Sphingobium]|uniref:DUF2336 domain-containing protein n=1 Tax=unclassified Sphingobium TaxID=2611147 RepID=UPI0007702467|nr:hypothetical protein K426_08120 [Sphingobium sp. TKS]NML89881.1 DUF2336 domain-containing protein [Sphingobium sp. TB-6]
MLADMSAFSSLIGPTQADCWPMAQVMAGMSAVPVGHAIDLAFFFPDEGRERHDALVAETRRHLGGCLTAIEIGLRLALEETPEIAAALAQWPRPVCWPTLRAQPTLLGPALLAHMQMRGGISLMLRQFGVSDGNAGGESEAESLFPADDPALGNALAALMLAEGRWLMTAAEDQPMQPDLPADFFAELLWTAAACLAAIVQRSGLMEPEAVLPLVEAAAQRLLARHDEALGPIAAADRLVRQLGDGADAPELMGAALGQRQFLLFAALAGRRLRMESAQVADILVMGPVGQVAALCRALGGSDADYRHLLLALRPVRPSLSDAAIVGEAVRYQDLTMAQADAAVNALRAPAALRAKLDHLLRISG